MKNSEYWRLRFEQLEQAQHDKTLEKLKEIETAFDQATNDIEKQLYKWYLRLASNNGISIQEAKKLLGRNELREFHWDVQEYIKHGKNNSDGSWSKELENASAKFHITRLEELQINTRNALENLYYDYGVKTKDIVENAYEDDYLHTAYEISKGVGIGFNVSKPDENMVSMILSKPWAKDQYNFSERIWKDKNKLIDTIHTEIIADLRSGKDPQKTINKVAAVMKSSKSNAGRVVMTEQAYFSTLARHDCMSDLNVKQYEVVVTLDELTCHECGVHDLEVHSMDEFQPGVSAPLYHPRCRCATAPHFENNYGVVGERAARDPETGKTCYVSADMTYEEWKDKFVTNKTKTEKPAAAPSKTKTSKAKSTGRGSKNSAVNVKPAEIMEVTVGHNVGNTGKVYRDEKIDFSARKGVDNSEKHDIIKSIDIDDFKLMATAGGRDIDPKAIDVIGSTVKKYEQSGEIYINDFYFGSLETEKGGTPLLQVEPVADKMLRLNVNTDVFDGRTLEEINTMIAATRKNVANNLEEASIHECGHAKSIKGKTIAEIENFYAKVKDAKITGVSDIAYNDGAEALAEIEILLSRNADVPEEALKFYNEHMKGR